jgi:hypothetical protein
MVMDILTLNAVLEEAIRLRVQFGQQDVEQETDFTMGKVVALDHMIEVLRDSIAHEDSLRSEAFDAMMGVPMEALEAL